MVVLRGVVSCLMAVSVVLVAFPASAQAEPGFYYRVDDPAGDGHASCTAAFGGAANPCDILALEAGSTPTHALFRWNLASLTFPPSASSAGVLYRLHFEDPGGDTYRVSVLVSASASAFGSLNGDPPQAGGAEFVVDRAAKTLTISVPLDSLDGAVPGAEIGFVLVSISFNANGGVNGSGLYFANFDTIPSAPPMVLQASGTSGGGGGPSLGPKQLEGDVARIEEGFANATSETRTFAWTTNLTAATMTYNVTVSNGTVSLTILDGENETVLEETLDESGNGSVPIDEAAPGNWSIRLAYLDFVGSIAVAIGPAGFGDSTGNATTTSTGTTSQPDGGITNDDNRTGTFPLSHEEKTPGLGPVALLVLVALAGLAARRRLR